MASLPLVEQKQVKETKTQTFIGGPGFDRAMVVLCCWFVGGVFVDGWAHNHGRVDNTFFTPWHALLYSGFFACAVLLASVVYLNHRRGYSWREAIPGGYELSLFGAPLFIAAGVGDLVWHTLFGFEVGIEPLLSPTHLLLAFSGILMLSGPFRATWRRADPISTHGWRTLLPAILSLTAVYSLFSFFTTFAHPFVETWMVIQASDNTTKAYGAASVLLQGMILMGFVLLALRRWRLPLGTWTVVFTLNIALVSVFQDQYALIPVAALAGIITDALYWWLKPSTQRLEALRMFAFAVPVVYYLCYFIAIISAEGTTWRIHLWLGSTVMAGIGGWLLSYIMAPPRGPEIEQVEQGDL